MRSNFLFKSNAVIKSTCNQIYIAPHELLKPYVAHYTISFPCDEETTAFLTLIPDASGCFVFTLNGESFDAVLWGPTTQTVIVNNDVNEKPLRLFVEFRPGGLFALTGLHQKELVNQRLPLEQACPLFARALLNQLDQAKDKEDLICRLDSFLFRQFVRSTSTLALSRARNTLLTSSSSWSVEELARKENYSERQLNRLFQQQLGMNVKLFARLVRVNHLIEQLNRSSNQTFTQLAHKNGFYDQSHFIHDFQMICGVPPTQYFKNKSEFYNETFKF